MGCFKDLQGEVSLTGKLCIRRRGKHLGGVAADGRTVLILFYFFKELFLELSLFFCVLCSWSRYTSVLCTALDVTEI